MKAITASALAAQAPAGWTATHGTGFAWSWDPREDEHQQPAELAKYGWVRFTRTEADLGITVQVALNVSAPGRGRHDRRERERVYRGRTVEGHTMYDGRSFTRLGIDCSSNRLTDMAGEHGADRHCYGDVASLLDGELQRCRAAHERSKTMIAVPGLPGGWKVTPTRREAISLSLQGGGIAEFRPHGMGTGYCVMPFWAARRGAVRLPRVTAEFFGVTGDLFYETLDCD